MVFFAPIVEGHGEQEAVPILLRRIAQHANARQIPRINAPIRVKSGSFLNNDQYFANYVGMAANKAAQENGTVLILLDCDDDCPASLGPSLLTRAKAVRDDVKYIVALARCEFEAWFIAAIESLNPGAAAPSEIESIRNAKGWLGERMGISYDPITHQHQFTRVFDLDLAQRSDSFKRLYLKICGLTGG
jgi:Domain of unknown function (DUF4276)